MQSAVTWFSPSESWMSPVKESPSGWAWNSSPFTWRITFSHWPSDTPTLICLTHVQTSRSVPRFNFTAGVGEGETVLVPTASVIVFSHAAAIAPPAARTHKRKKSLRLRRAFSIVLYFIPVRAMPRMKYFWKKIKIKRTGIVEITEPAKTTSQTVLFLRINSASPSCRVRRSELLMTISGQKKSFQTKVNVKIAWAARTGPHSGKTTLE